MIIALVLDSIEFDGSADCRVYFPAETVNGMVARPWREKTWRLVRVCPLQNYDHNAVWLLKPELCPAPGKREGARLAAEKPGWTPETLSDQPGDDQWSFCPVSTLRQRIGESLGRRERSSGDFDRSDAGVGAGHCRRKVIDDGVRDFGF